MAYPVNIQKFGFRLQKAIIIANTALAQYNHYDSLRRNEAGEIVRGPSFNNTLAKAAWSRYLRLQKHVKNIEKYWNNRYNNWENYRQRYDEIENAFTQAEIDSSMLAQKMEDIQTKILIAQGDNKLYLVTEFTKTCAEHNRVMKVLEYNRGQLKKLTNNVPQKVPSLEDVKIALNMAEGQTYKISQNDTIELPEALKSLRDTIIKRNKGEQVSRVEPKSPNPMDEILKSFAIDNKKIN